MARQVTAGEALAYLDREFHKEDRDDEKVRKVLSALHAVVDRLKSRSQARFYEFFGDFHRDQEDFAEAASAYTRLIAAEEAAGEGPVGLAHSWARLAGTQVSSEEFDTAHESILQAIRLLENGGQPSDYDGIWFGYGHKLWLQGRYQTAVSALEEAVRWAEKAGEPAKAMTGMFYFLINSLSQVAVLQSVAQTFSEITARAEEVGIAVEGALTPQIEEVAGSLAETLQSAQAVMAKVHESFAASPDDALYLKTLGDMIEILHAGKKHAETAKLGGRFRELLEQLGEEKENHQGALKALAEAHAELGNDEAEYFRALVIEEATDEEIETDSEEAESAPNVDFPFNWDGVDFDSNVLNLIDLDFYPASFDYLEEYQVGTGTWFVCAFARDGIRNLYGFLLQPGRNFADCPVVKVPEMQAEATTYCSSVKSFIPRRIRTFLYANWDEFSELDDAGWENLAALHRGIGGEGDLGYFRDFLKNPENKESLLEKMTLVEKIEPDFVPQLEYLFSDDLEPGFADPFSGVYGFQVANAYLERHEGPGELHAEAILTLKEGFCPLDFEMASLESWDAEFNGTSDEAHFEAALSALAEGRAEQAFRRLTFGCQVAQGEGDLHPEYLAAAHRLAELSHWTETHSALTYMRSLVIKEELSAESIAQISEYERRIDHSAIRE